ncbi:MAG: hypothetical protein SFV55_28970 [Haliscomenobacter sp.]|uniref:hypothetical protein n=1 Tax=Haliscomenobacter sp. TaxID=2717303 RepID=UPI0029B25C1A|nr:hypothetical protein [Haliscomenobacter sp.]MDX2072501.1 hypothetical protein [Haliscomenobacter sp.]
MCKSGILFFLFIFLTVTELDAQAKWGHLGGGPGHKFPVVTAYGNENLAAFWDDGKEIYCRRLENGVWFPWEPLKWPHGEEHGKFKVISWGPNRMDGFTTFEGDLYHTYWNGDSWSIWENLAGEELEGELELISWEPNRLDIFAISKGGGLRHLWWANEWGTWEELRNLKLPIDGFIKVCSWGPGRLDIFAQVSNRMEHLCWDNGWRNWQSLGGMTEGRFTAVSRDKGRIDVFAVGTDGKIWSRRFQLGTWEQWYELLIPVKTGTVLHAISRKTGDLDLFYTEPNGSLGYRWQSASGELSLQNLGGLMLGGLAATSWGEDRLDVVVMGGDRQFYHMPRDGQKWGY